MKYIFFSFFLVCSFALNAQTFTKDASGNYIQVAKARATANHDSTTTVTVTFKDGQTLPVFKGAKGGLYCWRTSKKGNVYKYYLPKE